MFLSVTGRENLQIENKVNQDFWGGLIQSVTQYITIRDTYLLKKLPAYNETWGLFPKPQHPETRLHFEPT
jgi:hypothetical protein